MKQYYIYLDNEQKGPLSFEELKEKNISRETLVWFEGQSDWKKAFEIEELKELFKSIPPPINSFRHTPPLPKANDNNLLVEEEVLRIFGVKRNVLIVIIGTLILLLIAFKYYQNYNQQVLENINKTTETQNQQIEEQQKEIEEQNTRIAEQERMEAERIAKEKKQAIDNRLFEIRNLLAENKQALEEAIRKLNDVTSFKLLRTASERNKQIQAAQSEVDYYKEEIRKLEDEFNTLTNREK